MTHPYGGPVYLFRGDAEDGTSLTTAQANMDVVSQTLEAIQNGEPGILRIYRPQPTAAFSPRDIKSEHFAAAAQTMRNFSFEPVERLAGGQLAVYDHNALIVDLVAPHNEPRAQVLERFRLFAGVIASALATLSVDARIGPLAGEYCPGDYSVNGAGRIKLAGLAQRIGRRGYHLGAVLSITPSGRAKAAVAAAYKIFGAAFDPLTFGSVADLTPNPSFAVIRNALTGIVMQELNTGEAASGVENLAPSSLN